MYPALSALTCVSAGPVNLADPEGHHRKRPDPAPAGPRTPSAEEIAAHAAGLQDDAAAPAANGAVSVQVGHMCELWWPLMANTLRVCTYLKS